MRVKNHGVKHHVEEITSKTRTNMQILSLTLAFIIFQGYA